ncbi:hypothetical protein N7492_001979 [Penicillium capsulatum]|uniref:Uncharacterized protein n=1 Tax=Penicillium capsulatum TaxID=69766 RepID=A0A9W9IGZ5_9EURO|nr:hypothetical protein N7492_001979 [Penicillium capsulatum]KAJ6123401.1 hypothetical protein N7512_005866 [Penicillium capsulatum]
MAWNKERYQRLLVAIYDTHPKLDWNAIFENLGDGGRIETTRLHICSLRRASKKRDATILSPGLSESPKIVKRNKIKKATTPNDPVKKEEIKREESGEHKQKIKVEGVVKAEPVDNTVGLKKYDMKSV